MFTFFNSILTRLVGANEPSTTLDGKLCNAESRHASLDYIAQRPNAFDEKTRMIAEAVLETLLTSSHGGPELASQLQSLVPKNDNDQEFSANGWTESLALAVFSGLKTALENVLKTPMGSAMADAYYKVASVLTEMAKDAVGFIEEHPVYVTLLTLGILVCLAPWAVEALGFGALGPIEGSFAAWWQAKFVGYVPKGSVFSFFQRLGMVWRW